MAEGTSAGSVDVDEVMSSVAAVSVSDASSTLQHPYSMHGRVVIAKVLALGREAVGKEVVAGGWVKTGRVQVRLQKACEKGCSLAAISPLFVDFHRTFSLR